MSRGQPLQVVAFGGTRLDISDFPTRHNYGLALSQSHFERILAGWVSELAVPILRGREVTDFAQDDTGVDVALSDGRSLRAQWLLGCDGGRSLVRKKTGIDFPGWDPSISYLIAEASMTEEPAWGLRRDAKGTYAIGKLEDGKRAGIVLREERVEQGEPTQDELRAALIELYGMDFGIHDVTFLSRFTDAIALSSDRVKRIDARYAGTWELPVVGAVASPSAVLVRPDGYVAWVGEGTDAGLRDALAKWFSRTLAKPS